MVVVVSSPEMKFSRLMLVSSKWTVLITIWINCSKLKVGFRIKELKSIKFIYWKMKTCKTSSSQTEFWLEAD